MSHEVAPAEWLDLAVGLLEDAKRSLAAGVPERACGEIRRARRCADRCLLATAENVRIEKEWSTR